MEVKIRYWGRVWWTILFSIGGCLVFILPVCPFMSNWHPRGNLNYPSTFFALDLLLQAICLIILLGWVFIFNGHIWQLTDGCLSYSSLIFCLSPSRFSSHHTIMIQQSSGLVCYTHSADSLSIFLEPLAAYWSCSHFSLFFRTWIASDDQAQLLNLL